VSAPPLWHRYDGPMNDAPAATHQLLRGLNVAAAPGSVAGYVTAHPAYPSLAAIVDGLAEFGVRASARRITPEALIEVDAPALVHVRDDDAKSAFWLISDQRNGRFECRLPNGEARSLAHEELAAKYLGLVVSGTAEPGAGERYAARHELGDRLRARLPLAAIALFVTALAVSCAAASLAPADMMPVAFCLTGFVGLALTLYLSLRDRVRGSSLFARLCPTGKTFNCASVIGSPAGYLGGVVPLADLGAAFFAAQSAAAVTAALCGRFGAFLALFTLSSVVLVPVVLYSVAQQAFTIRRWCPLCLLVGAVVVAELALASRSGLHALSTLDLRAGVLLGGSALTAAFAYAVARPLVTPALAAPRLHAELEGLRGMPETLAAALARTAPVALEAPNRLVDGDEGAPVEVLVVSHPFCVACADAHEALRRLVEAFPRLLRTATLFSVSESDRAAAAAARGLLSGSMDLDDWYSRVNENVEEWIRRGSPDDVAPEQSANLAAQRALAERTGVARTPAVFVNGRALPPGFGLHHLRFYLRAEQRRLRNAEAPAPESA
jgi:uncharacterized membrane protein